MSQNTTLEEEWSTPCVTRVAAGAGGDGLKISTPKKRVVLPPVQKLHLTPNDQKRQKSFSELQEKLRKAPPLKLKKATSVAGSTPTKIKNKKRLKIAHHDSSPSAALHVTPRLLEAPPPPPRCLRARAECRLYQGVLVYVWRRLREKYTTLDESSRRHEEKIAQQELQIQVLKNLEDAERTKREETILVCEQLTNDLDVVQNDNAMLSQSLYNVEFELLNNQNEVEAARKEIFYLQDQQVKLQEKLKDRRDETLALKEKVSSLKDANEQLELNLSNTKNNLHNAEVLHKTIQEKYDELLKAFKKEVEIKLFVQNEFKTLQKENSNLSLEYHRLKSNYCSCEEHCKQIEQDYVKLRNENQVVVKELDREKKRSWWKSFQELSMLALGSINHIAILMLPVYRAV